MPFPAYIDNTIRKAFATCPTKARWAHIEDLRPIGEKSIHLHFGACFAKGLELARRAFFVEGAHEQDAISSAVEDALEAFGDAGEGYKTADRLEGALYYYFQKWPMGRDFLRPVEGGIECGFELPLPILHPETGKLLNYVGRYDMLGIDEQARLWVVDEKTASRLGDMWDAKWDLDCQLTGYIWSVQQQVRRGERKHPTAELDVRAMVRAVSVLRTDYGHTEVPMVRSAWYVDRWYGQLVRDVERMVESYKTGVWDLALHETACVQYGRKCDYNPLCLTPHPDRLIDGLYEKVVWNPLAKEGD